MTRLVSIILILVAVATAPGCIDKNRTIAIASEALNNRDYASAMTSILANSDKNILASDTLMQMLSTAFYGLSPDVAKVTDDIASDCYDMAFTPDMKTVIFNDAANGILKLYAYPDMEYQRSITLPYPAYNIAVSPDGKRLAAALDNADILVFDLASGEMTERLSGHSAAVRDVVFCDSTMLISCSNDQNIVAWNVTDTEPLWRRHQHAKNIKSLQLSPDSSMAISASNDGSAVVFPTALADGGKEIHRFIHGQNYVNDAAITPGNKAAVTVSGDGAVKLWNMENGKMLKSKMLAEPLGAVAISPDGGLMLVAGQQNVFILDSENLKVINRINTANMPVWSARFTGPGWIAFTDNSHFYQYPVLTGNALVTAARKLSK